MKAGYYEDLGPARSVLRVGELPTPAPGPGEVLVRVRASGVNPSDVKSRGGMFGRARFLGLTVPHSDGAGDIAAVGQGVAASRVGQRVWLWNGQYKRALGTAAEYIALPAEMAVPLPEGVDYAAGACLGIPAMTACQAVRLVAPMPGDNVLVSGGAGAVGHYAVQFAAHRGARVIATVSSEAKAAHALAAGAAATINYKTENVAERIKELCGADGLQGLVEMELTVNAPLLQCLRPFGRVAVYGVSGEVTLPGRFLLQSQISLNFVYVYEQNADLRAAVIAEIQAALRAGKLQNAVARRLPLDAIAEAHELVEQGKAMGNVILDI